MNRVSQHSRRRLGGLAVAALTLSACGSGESASTEAAAEATNTSPTTAAAAAEPASDFPQFTAATIDGAQIEFGSLAGKDTVVWFWAPW